MGFSSDTGMKTFKSGIPEPAIVLLGRFGRNLIRICTSRETASGDSSVPETAFSRNASPDSPRSGLGILTISVERSPHTKCMARKAHRFAWAADSQAFSKRPCCFHHSSLNRQYAISENCRTVYASVSSRFFRYSNLYCQPLIPSFFCIQALNPAYNSLTALVASASSVSTSFSISSGLSTVISPGRWKSRKSKSLHAEMSSARFSPEMYSR